MKRSLLALAAMALTAALLGVPASLAKHAPPPCTHPPGKWADLDVSKVTIRTPAAPAGSPYLVEDRDGSTQNFSVDVDVRNIGGAAACKSLLYVVLRNARPTYWRLNLTVPALAPKKQVTIVVPFNQVKLFSLQPMAIRAHVNPDGYVPELSHHNNTNDLKREPPVIARYWKATRASVHGVISASAIALSEDFTDRADPGFSFQYSRYDQQAGIFFYDAQGAITEDRDVGPGPAPGFASCSGTGTGHASHTQWPSSTYLGISYAANRYSAAIDPGAAGDRFTTAETCTNPGLPAQTINTDTPFTSFGTWPVVIGTTQGSTRLMGGPVAKSAPSLGGSATLTYVWQFDADIP
jgi:hypothetical protein